MTIIAVLCSIDDSNSVNHIMMITTATQYNLCKTNTNRETKVDKRMIAKMQLKT